MIFFDKTDITYVDIFIHARNRFWMSSEFSQNYELFYVRICRWKAASFLFIYLFIYLFGGGGVWIPEIPINYEYQLITKYLHLDS